MRREEVEEAFSFRACPLLDRQRQQHCGGVWARKDRSGVRISRICLTNNSCDDDCYVILSTLTVILSERLASARVRDTTRRVLFICGTGRGRRAQETRIGIQLCSTVQACAE